MSIIKDKYSLVYSNGFDVDNKIEQQIDLVLTPSNNQGSSIIGEIRDKDGKTVKGATVKLFEKGDKPFRHVLTNESGEYSFDDLTAGSYAVTAVNEDCPITVPQVIVLNANEIRTVNVVITPDENIKLGTIAGIAIEKNDEIKKNIIGSKIFLKNATTDETVATTVTADDGEFVFYEIPDGAYNIIGTKDGYQTSDSVNVIISKGSIINCVITMVKDPIANTGTVSGYVKSNNIGVSGVYVGLYIFEGTEGARTETLIATTRTNSTGYYMFGNVSTGNYIVKAKQNS